MEHAHTPATDFAPSDLVPLTMAARQLGISEDTIRRWGSKGRLREFRDASGRRRYSMADVRALAPVATAVRSELHS